jgi:hypothetical protein
MSILFVTIKTLCQDKLSDTPSFETPVVTDLREGDPRVRIKFFLGYWLIWLSVWSWLSRPMIIRQRSGLDYQVLWQSSFWDIWLIIKSILTNCHNLFGNPLQWPICVLGKHSLFGNPFQWHICVLGNHSQDRIKVWRGCTYSVGLFSLGLISGPVRCDGCGSLHFNTWWTVTSGGRPRGDNGKMILDFYSVNCLVRWIVDRIGKVGRDVVKRLIISDNQAFSCLIIKSFDNQTCDLTRSVILPKTRLKGWILIIKSTYQPWSDFRCSSEDPYTLGFQQVCYSLGQT